MSKFCHRCSTEKEESEFYKANNRKDGLQTCCISCDKAFRQEKYDIFIKTIMDIKDVPCMDCGEKYPSYVMDFDHRDKSEKLFNIGQGRCRGIDSVHAEIAKCDIVCSNCHRERTYGNKE